LNSPSGIFFTDQPKRQADILQRRIFCNET
jgi:hypothetical protein